MMTDPVVMHLHSFMIRVFGRFVLMDAASRCFPLGRIEACRDRHNGEWPDPSHRHNLHAPSVGRNHSAAEV